MIAHQAVGMHGNVVPLERFLEKREIDLKVGFLEKTSHPVVAALDDMERQAGNDQAGGTRHSRTTSRSALG
jgi:hypothetical protein